MRSRTRHRCHNVTRAAHTLFSSCHRRRDRGSGGDLLDFGRGSQSRAHRLRGDLAKACRVPPALRTVVAGNRTGGRARATVRRIQGHPASGLPVVVSDRGGPCENLLPGESGIVCRGGDVTSFASAVQELSDPGRRASFSAAARRYAESRSWVTSLAGVCGVPRSGHESRHGRRRARNVSGPAGIKRPALGRARPPPDAPNEQSMLQGQIVVPRLSTVASQVSVPIVTPSMVERVPKSSRMSLLFPVIVEGFA